MKNCNRICRLEPLCRRRSARISEYIKGLYARSYALHGTGSYTEKEFIVLYNRWREEVSEGTDMGGFVNFANSKKAKSIMEEMISG